jgi:hypothetical protein
MDVKRIASFVSRRDRFLRPVAAGQTRQRLTDTRGSVFQVVALG